MKSKHLRCNSGPDPLLSGTSYEDGVGVVRVEELDWTNHDHRTSVNPPFDFVLAADCVYHENHLHDLLATILEVTSSKSTGVKTSLHMYFRELKVGYCFLQEFL